MNVINTLRLNKSDSKSTACINLDTGDDFKNINILINTDIRTVSNDKENKENNYYDKIDQNYYDKTDQYDKTASNFKENVCNILSDKDKTIFNTNFSSIETDHMDLKIKGKLQIKSKGKLKITSKNKIKIKIKKPDGKNIVKCEFKIPSKIENNYFENQLHKKGQQLKEDIINRQTTSDTWRQDTILSGDTIGCHVETDTLRQDSTKLDVTDLINPDILKDITNLINDNNSELTNSIYNPAEIKNISRYTSVVRQKVIENLFGCIQNITGTSISEVTISTVSLGFTPDEIQKEIHIVTLINTLTIIAEPLDLNGFKADERFYIPLKSNDKIKIRLFKTVVSIERIDDNVDCEDYYHLTIPTQYKSYIKDFDLYKPTNDKNGNSIIILERDKRLQVRFTKEKYKFREIEIGKLLDRGVIVGPIKALEASNEIRIPLQFWFNRHIGLSLPIVAIENKVSIKIKLNKLKRQWYNKLFDDSNMTVALWCNYILLDEPERYRMSRCSHEYLIEQVQFHEATKKTNNYLINFKNPIKEIIWIGSNNNMCDPTNVYGYSTPMPITNNVRDKLSITFNNVRIFDSQTMNYFSKYQVNQYHTGKGTRGMPIQNGVNKLTYCLPQCTIGVYSFSLTPEEHQPSGVCHFKSKYNRPVMEFTNITNGLLVYARSYNVLKINKGRINLEYPS